MFKINKHRFNNDIFFNILFGFRYIFFIIINFSIKLSGDPKSDPTKP